MSEGRVRRIVAGAFAPVGGAGMRAADRKGVRPRRVRWSGLLRGASSLLFAAGLCPGFALGQQGPLELKRTVPTAGEQPCFAPFSPPVRPSASDADLAVSLAGLAAQSGIVGDHATARELLERAARLDPTAEDVAYLLARTLEELGDTPALLSAYCRYLALAPTAPEAEEIRGKAARIAPERLAVPQSAATAFLDGIAHFDARRFADAQAAFSSAIAVAPAWSAAYYNRALVHMMRDSTAAALSDINRYVELEPELSERELVVALIALPRGTEANRPHGAVAVFLVGLVPGAGHIYASRPLTGLGFMAGAATAVAIGALYQVRTVECLALPVGGTCPANQVRATVTKRPFLAYGTAAAVAITLFGAVDAARGAAAVVPLDLPAAGRGDLLLLPATPPPKGGGVAWLGFRF